MNNSTNCSTNATSCDKAFAIGALVGWGTTFGLLGAGYLIRRFLDKASVVRVGPAPVDQQIEQTNRAWMTATTLYCAEQAERSASESLRSPDEQQHSSREREPREGSNYELQSSSSGQPSAGGSEPRLFTLRRHEAVDRGSLQSSQSGGRSTDGSGPQMASSNQPSSSLTVQPSSSGTGPGKDILTKTSLSHVCLPSDQPSESARVNFTRSTIENMKNAKSRLPGLGRTDDSEFGAMRPVAKPSEPRPEPSFTD